MKLQKLTKIQRAYIFNKYLINDFHESEVKPFELIEDLIENGHYKCYGFYEEEDLLGYAYFIKSKDSILMDYLSVNSEYRCKGLGSSFISTIKEKFSEKYSALIAEVENPRYSLNDDDKCNRERRISFYIRNGFKLSNIETCVFTDQYTIIILKLAKELEDKAIDWEMRNIYKTIFGVETFRNNITVSTSNN